MPNILSTVLTNPNTLVDNQTYQVGDDGQMKTSQASFKGKVAAFFRSADTVALRNQAVLDSIAQEVKGRYGSGSLNGVPLALPHDLSRGRPINGQDIKLLTANLLNNIPRLSDAIKTMTENLSPVLRDDLVKVVNVLNQLRMSIRNVADEEMGYVLTKSLGKLSTVQLDKLATVLNSDKTANITGLLQEAQAIFSMGIDHNRLVQAQAAQDGINQTTSLLAVINACKEVLPQEQAARNWTGDITAVPVAHQPAALPNWLNASPQLKSDMTTLGVGNPVALAITLLANNYMGDDMEEFCRADTPATSMLRASTNLAVKSLLPGLENALSPIFADAPNNNGELAQWGAERMTNDKQEALMDALNNQALKEVFEGVIRLINDFKPQLSLHYPHAKPGEMEVRMFNAIGTLPLFQIMHTHEMPSIKSASIYLQRETDVDKVIGRGQSKIMPFFESLAGWNRMIQQYEPPVVGNQAVH